MVTLVKWLEYSALHHYNTETLNVKKHNSATFGAKVIGLQHESGAFV